MNDKNTSVEPNPCIILVDDNPGDVHIMVYALESLFPKAKVLSFETGEEFIAFWERSGTRPDNIVGIFLDLNMPGMCGMETLTSLITKSKIQYPVYIFSGTIVDSLKEEAKSLGALDFLEKPVGLEEVSELFRKLFHPQLSVA